MNSPVELWLRESNKRKSLAQQSECYRLVDKTNQQYDIRIDRLGEVLSFQYFAELAPTEQILSFAADFAKQYGAPYWFFRTMINRGKDPNLKTLWKSDESLIQWTATENGISYIFKLNEGTSPGLFLDQRERRKWVLEHSKDKHVLNLFCYTGGFSVAAALGHAAKTTSVDVGAKYIEWTKQNFEINKLNLNTHEFWTVDSFDFLEGAVKRKHTFDMIICDPPSFGRSKRGAFKLSKDYRTLLSLCAQALLKKGVLVFSTNLEEWTQNEFEKKCAEAARDLKLNVLNFPAPPNDFNSAILKTCVFSKN